MNYSKTHQNFSNYFHPEALTAPENFLGPNYETVINFWTFMDSLTEDNWKEVASRYLALDYATVNAARDAAWYAAGVAAGDVAGATAEVAPPHRHLVFRSVCNLRTNRYVYSTRPRQRNGFRSHVFKSVTVPEPSTKYP